MNEGRSSICTLVLLMGFMLAACADPGLSDRQLSDDRSSIHDFDAGLPTQIDMDHKIEITVSVESYSDQGWRDHYVDDGYAFYKISVLKINEPVEYLDKILMINHGESPDESSVWRDAGAQFQLRISEELLEMMAGETGFVSITHIDIVESREELVDMPVE